MRHLISRLPSSLAYSLLKLSLRLCRFSGLSNPRGLALDAAGDIGWSSSSPRTPSPSPSSPLSPSRSNDPHNIKFINSLLETIDDNERRIDSLLNEIATFKFRRSRESTCTDSHCECRHARPSPKPEPESCGRLPVVLAYSSGECSATWVLRSGRPNHVLVVTEEAWEGDYHVEAKFAFAPPSDQVPPLVALGPDSTDRTRPAPF